MSKASPERCDDAVGLQDLQEEANEIEIIFGRIFIRTAMIHFDIEDPTTVDAAWCFKQYFGELNDRFDGGFAQTEAFQQMLMNSRSQEASW